MSDKDCIVLNSDQQLAVSSENRYLYPDAMVVCGQATFEDKKQARLSNPCLIVEVLSPSTAEYDRSAKFNIYKKIPSFKEYVLINSDRICVDTFYRESDELCRISSAYKLDMKVHLFSLGIDISVRDIYHKIDGLKEGD